MLDRADVNYHIPLPEGPDADKLIFTDSITIPFSTSYPVKMVYTLDGTTPTKNSNVYKSPITISQNSTLKIASILPHGKMSAVRTLHLKKVNYIEATDPENTLTPGLNITTFYGYFETIPDLSKQKEAKTTTITEIKQANTTYNWGHNIEPDNFKAVILEGFIKVTNDGIYAFSSAQDEVWIADKLIIENNKDVEVWILLIDERPEEVTDIKETVKGAQVYASTFDDDPRNHIKVTETLLERAKRKIENGENVVILMDSLTRLARAYNIVIPSSGKLISGGIDPTALYYPKKFFGSARNIRNGGSLTIIATALVETGSKMDDVIYEEFKGTGNLDIHLDRNLSELRIYPAIDIQKSGTRKEELLISKKKLESIWKIRRYLCSFDKATGTKKLIDTISSTESNDKLIEMYENSYVRGK